MHYSYMVFYAVFLVNRFPDVGAHCIAFTVLSKSILLSAFMWHFSKKYYTSQAGQFDAPARGKWQAPNLPRCKHVNTKTLTDACDTRECNKSTVAIYVVTHSWKEYMSDVDRNPINSRLCIPHHGLKCTIESEIQQQPAFPFYDICICT